MIKYFQRSFAMSKEGAKDLLISIMWTVLMDLSFFIPVIFSFKFLTEYLGSLLGSGTTTTHGISYYLGMTAVSMIIMFIIARFQYNSTYTKIYEESAKSRIELAETLRKLPLAYFGKKDVADLSSTIMEDATQIEQLFSHAVPQLFASGVGIVLIASMMFVYNWRMASAVFWVVPIALLLFFVSRKYQTKMHTDLYYSRRDISDNIQEGLDSIYEIKSYNRERSFAKKLDTKLDDYEKVMIKGELMLGCLINFSYVVLKLGLPSVMLFGAYFLSAGLIDIFTYIVFLIISARVYNPIIEVMNNLAMLLYLGVRINRKKEMNSMPRQEGITEFEPANYDIEFSNVDFSYLGDVQTLSNVSFVAKQGEVTALVGPSGGGKSTVAKLSARFWDADNGLITLGGSDISKIDPETLLKYYSIVFQDVTLFNTSIMDNIRLGKKDATDEEVIAAASLAQCDEFVNKLSHGYETMIGENGEKLSGGERQRISIARAILKDTPIILLDEATASLDAENESKIQSALSELVKNKTVLIIAHRMRTVLGADKIVVIKDGGIAETGSPEELDKKQGIFNSMHKRQFQQG